MDRISKLFIYAACLTAQLSVLPAFSDTVLLAPEKETALKPGESYPESRFGSPPARVETGVSRGYASRAVEELEARDRDEERGLHSVSGARGPAGLEFGNSSGQRLASASATNATTATATTTESARATARPVITSATATSTRSASTAAPTSSGQIKLPEPQDAFKKGVQEVALIAGDLGFFPKTVFVTRDVPVRLFVTGASKNTLCLMMDSFQVRKQIRSNRIEEITFTPSTPGKYRFYCPVNGMEGSLVVKEFAQRQ